MDGKAKLKKGPPYHQGPGRPIRQQFISIIAFPTPDQLYQDFRGLGKKGVIMVQVLVFSKISLDDTVVQPEWRTMVGEGS